MLGDKKKCYFVSGVTYSSNTVGYILNLNVHFWKKEAL